MTENSSSAYISCDPIDVYLDAVERAMTAAHAPRADRLQVLQDLEAQIADMLSQQPQPLTEEAVCAVIASLEPPSHFVETYANAKEEPAPQINHSGSIAYSRWAVGSAISCGLIPLSCVLLLFAAAGHLHGPAIGAPILLMLIGAVLTPIALRKAFKQLRAEPGQHLGRELALRAMASYGVAVPALLFVLVCAATDGYILFPVGIAAFGYLQYVHVRRLWQRVADTLPPQSTVTPTSDAHEHRPTSPPSLSNAMSMAAM
jgi:hypothetical protein